MHCMAKKLGDPDFSKRLESARIAAKFESASDAARALGVNDRTYIGHRGASKQNAALYARRFNVNLEWLQTGTGPRERRPTKPDDQMINVVGYVSAGQAHFFDSGKLDEVDAPSFATDTTVAVEIRGTSLGEAFDGWLVFYDDVQRPVSTDHYGRLCVVGLFDGRILVKLVKKARGKNTVHLFSNTEPPILDTEVEWAAKVLGMRPR